MSIKPWLSKNFLQKMSWSSVRDYPPKTKKAWLSDNFMEMEEVHSGHIDSLPAGSPMADGGLPLPPPPDIPQDPGDAGAPDSCAGPRSLWVLVSPSPTVDCAVDTGFSLIISPDFKCIELTQAFFDEDGPKIVDSLGNTLEHPTNAEDIIGGLKLEKGCNDPPWITLWVCDCLCGGCSTATIWLDNCGTDCDAVFVSGPSTIAANGAGQYALINFPPEAEQVQWDVTGTGASIDQNGLLTTVDACGTLEVRASTSCCGDKVLSVVVADNGYWHIYPFCDIGGDDGDECFVYNGPGERRRYVLTDCGDSVHCGTAPCFPADCPWPNEGINKTKLIEDQVWECPP